MRFVKWMFVSVCFLACSSSSESNGTPGSDGATSGGPDGSTSSTPDGGGADGDTPPTPDTPTPGSFAVACATAIANDGVCSIREALANAADGKRTHADCAAGAASNTVVLPAGCKFEFTEVDNVVKETAGECQYSHVACVDTIPCAPPPCVGGRCTGSGSACSTTAECNEPCVVAPSTGNALPIVKSTVIIEGHGSTLTRKSGAQAMRFFEISEGGSLTLKDATLSEGSAPAVGGGAILVAGSLVVSGSTFTNNKSALDGGAIAGTSSSCKISVTNSKFEGSQTLAAGGAIEQSDCVLTVDQSTFSTNSSSDAGGAVNCNSSEAACTVTNSTFDGNSSATYGGGAISFFNEGPKSVSQCTFYGNKSSTDGGAISAWSGPVTITFSTFSANECNDDGGGLAVHLSNVTLASSVFEGNVDPGGEAPDVHAGDQTTSGGYNHIESSAGGFVSRTGDTVGTSPEMGAPANTGGTTTTISPDANSPVVDAIPAGTNGCGTTYATDQRGKPRPNAGGCDKGAVEL